MKTYQKTVYKGEYLGPVDWNYDFDQHGIHSSCVETGKSVMRQIETWLAEDPDAEIWVTESGDYTHRLLKIGMYDGWPWWKPVPHVLTQGVLCPAWQVFYNLTHAKLRTSKFKSAKAEGAA